MLGKVFDRTNHDASYLAIVAAATVVFLLVMITMNDYFNLFLYFFHPGPICSQVNQIIV